MSEENKTNQVEQCATVKRENGGKILNIRFQRDPSNCRVQLHLKSKQNWDLLKREDSKSFIICGVKCSYPKIDTFDGVPCRFITENAWEYNEMPNLSILLANNLQDGVTFELGQIPISDGKIKDYLNKVKESVKILYLTHFKPIDIQVDITAATIEHETHY